MSACFSRGGRTRLSSDSVRGAPVASDTLPGSAAARHHSLVRRRAQQAL